MKEVTVGPVWARATMESAFDAVFGEATLRSVHGPSVRVPPWMPDHRSPDTTVARRTLRFDVAVDGVPPEIRRFFCGKVMRVTGHQVLSRQPQAWTVTNKLRMHFLGAELFSVRPRFVLTADRGGGVELSGTVQHRARLPPPLKGLAEELMARHSRRELDRFAAAARQALATGSHTRA